MDSRDPCFAWVPRHRGNDRRSRRRSGMKMRLILTAVVFVVLVFVAAAFSALNPDAVPRVTVEELKAMLLGGRDVVILDVRSGGSYNASKVKIKGAVRIPPQELKDRFSEISKGKKVVAYCT